MSRPVRATSAKVRTWATLSAFFALGAFAFAAPQRAPSASESKKLVEKYFDAEAPERAEILAKLALLPPLTEKDLGKWLPQLEKLARKAGPRLEKSGQAYFYDEDEKRGRYIVSAEGDKGLVICMHGGGAGAGDASSAASSFQAATSKMRWTAIFPEVLEKTEHGWTDSGTEEFVLELVDAGLRTFDIDPDRVYFCGHSMGGYGTWTLGGHHADRVAALAAYAGAPSPLWNNAQKVIGIEEGVLPSLFNVPIHVYQSRDDQQVPFEVNHFAAGALDRLREEHGGYVHVYQEVDGRGHGFPEGGPLPALEWAGGFVRDPRPVAIRWEPVLKWKKQFYWLRWESPRLRSLVVAKRDGNTFEVTVGGPCPGLSLCLDDRLIDFDEDVIVRLDGEEVFRGKVERTLASLLELAVEHPDPKMWYPAVLKFGR